jgi:hypothetical protein
MNRQGRKERQGDRRLFAFLGVLCVLGGLISTAFFI